MYCYFCMKEIEANTKKCPHCGNNQDIITPPHRLLPGTVLNERYVVGVAKGEGGFGITYIGLDKKLDRIVAIKEYYPTGYVNRSNTISPNVSEVTSEASDAFFRKGCDRFLREAKTIAKFSGEPGIVNVIDYFEENNTAYIIMEYLDGITLRDYLKQKEKLSVDETMRILRPIMLSLEKIHQQGLIHRDISPSNIMLVDGAVKLIDFGAARTASAEKNKSLSLMLKPGYAPEEQYRSKGVQGPWTDVYAICATIYKCITGITPEEANDRIYEDEIKTTSVLGVNVDTRFETALMKGLAVHQKDRYQSIKELLNGLYGEKSSIVLSEEKTEAAFYPTRTNQLINNSQTECSEDEQLTSYIAGSEKEDQKETQFYTESEEEKETQYYTESEESQNSITHVSQNPEYVNDNKKTNPKNNTTDQNINLLDGDGVVAIPKKSHHKSLIVSAFIGCAVLILGTVVCIAVINGKDNTSDNRETVVVQTSTSYEESTIPDSNEVGLDLLNAHFFALPYDGIATIANDNTVKVTYVDSIDWEKVDEAKEWNNIKSLAAGYKNLYGLRTDGTVVATGNNEFGQCNVSEWKDVKLVDACYEHTVALKSDGTAFAVGKNTDGRCDVQKWDHLIYVSAGRSNTIGLKDDGTVLVVGGNEWHQSDISDWNDMKMVSAGYYHTVGLKTDGTVVAQGDNKFGQCNASDWKDVTAVYAGKMHTVALKKDGTVVATGNNDYGQCNVSSWKNVTELYVEKNYTVGKTASGELLITGLCFYDDNISERKYFLDSYRGQLING